MTELVSKIVAFSYMSLLHHQKTTEKIYRLLSDTTTTYFRMSQDSNGTEKFELLEANGRITTGSHLRTLFNKIRVYERLFGNSLDLEKLENLLRMNEVKFLLSEIGMNRPELEDRIFNRLTA